MGCFFTPFSTGEKSGDTVESHRPRSSPMAGSFRPGIGRCKVHSFQVAASPTHRKKARGNAKQNRFNMGTLLFGI
jgi:hypothetical protein